MGRTRWVLPSRGFVTWLVSKAGGTNGSREKINKNLMILR
jgi:hypothetical protein